MKVSPHLYDGKDFLEILIINLVFSPKTPATVYVFAFLLFLIQDHSSDMKTSEILFLTFITHIILPPSLYVQQLYQQRQLKPQDLHKMTLTRALNGVHKQSTLNGYQKTDVFLCQTRAATIIIIISFALSHPL